MPRHFLAFQKDNKMHDIAPLRMVSLLVEDLA